MQELSHIKNYILYLKTKQHLYITLHPMTAHAAQVLSALLVFNIHDHPYCVFLKTCPMAQAHCIERQDKIIEKCKCGAFTGTCFAGVREFVYPIRCEGEVVGFLSVSGYRTEGSESYLLRTSREYAISHGELTRAYGTLAEKMPPKSEIDLFLLPLSDMLELALTRAPRGEEGGLPFATRVVRYLKQYHNQPITSRDLCAYFSCSRSYLSTAFNRHTGKSLREYLNALRTEDAKLLLVSSELSVTEIAYLVGFTDPNYFSVTFKKRTGVSPLAYRRIKNI